MNKIRQKLLKYLEKWLKKHGMKDDFKVEVLQDRLKEKFADMAVPMKYIEFSRENYDSLFPNNRVSTPIGEIKIGENQFEKLIAEKREKYLGGMHQTLTEPIAIINQENEKGKSQIFSKSFTHKPKKKDGIVSVVADIDGQKVSISTHPKKLAKVAEGIKNTADLEYEIPNSGRTAGNDPKVLAISDDTQLFNNISQILPKVNEKIEKHSI